MQAWWKEIVGYQLYPKTFKDSNQDGIGDIQGILSKLDYLQELGIDAIWICPFYQSPMIDNGYDVSDFFAVDPCFGTLEDIKELIHQLHLRQMYLITDLVLSHTSDQHPWFKKACEEMDSEERSYYIWRDPRYDEQGKRVPPTNWSGFVGGSWVFHELSNQYYMKIFADQMPDLNWSNPKLREKMAEVATYWLELGVDGFRIDAVAHLGRDWSFQDIPGALNESGYAFDMAKFSNREEVFVYLKELKDQVFSKYDCVCIGEVGGGADTKEAIRYAGYDQGSLNMVFTFDHCWENGLYGNEEASKGQVTVNVLSLKHKFLKWYEELQGKAWNAIYWLNHDHPRIVSHYGNDQEYHVVSAKMLCSTLYFMYGTPFLYNGEEIGMTNVDYERIDQFHDHAAHEYYKENKESKSEAELIAFLRMTSRDNARSPMQWSSDSYAGFSEVEPICQVNGNYSTINVEAQRQDPNSIWSHYKKVLAYRKHKEFKQVIRDGEFHLIQEQHVDVFAYQRIWQSQAIIVISNFRKVSVDFKFTALIKEMLVHNYQNIIYDGNTFTLRPFESMVFTAVK